MKNDETTPSDYPELPRKLSRLVQFATVSSYDPKEEDEDAFAALKSELVSLFPLVHETLQKEEPSDRALLYTWQGRNPALKPAVLCAHFDVVPAPEEEKWLHKPFSGDIDGGEVWGRGAQDIKVLMVSILESAELLLSKGFTPERTIYFAFGGDEEVGGMRGAHALATDLAQKGVKASFLLDEGGPIAKGMLSFASCPLGLVGVAEKGYVDLLVQTKGQGGHASMPPKRTAPGDLGRAIAAIEAHPSRARLTRTIRSFLAHLAPFSRQPYRFLFNNLWLTAPVIKLAFGGSPSTNALIRTTMACTMLKGSSKENVLADYAQANINVRILPGETSAEVVSRLGQLLGPYGAEVSIRHAEHVVEPSAESGTDHEGWRAIAAALGRSHPEAACIPFLFSAGTDTKHYKDLIEATYRFTPLIQSQEDLNGVHGDNERVRIEDLRRCARFYTGIMEAL